MILLCNSGRNPSGNFWHDPLTKYFNMIMIFLLYWLNVQLHTCCDHIVLSVRTISRHIPPPPAKLLFFVIISHDNSCLLSKVWRLMTIPLSSFQQGRGAGGKNTRGNTPIRTKAIPIGFVVKIHCPFCFLPQRSVEGHGVWLTYSLHVSMSRGEGTYHGPHVQSRLVVTFSSTPRPWHTLPHLSCPVITYLWPLSLWEDPSWQSLCWNIDLRDSFSSHIVPATAKADHSVSIF